MGVYLSKADNGKPVFTKIPLVDDKGKSMLIHRVVFQKIRGTDCISLVTYGATYNFAVDPNKLTSSEPDLDTTNYTISTPPRWVYNLAKGGFIFTSDFVEGISLPPGHELVALDPSMIEDGTIGESSWVAARSLDGGNTMSVYEIKKIYRNLRTIQLQREGMGLYTEARYQCISSSETQKRFVIYRRAELYRLPFGADILKFEDMGVFREFLPASFAAGISSFTRIMPNTPFEITARGMSHSPTSVYAVLTLPWLEQWSEFSIHQLPKATMIAPAPVELTADAKWKAFQLDNPELAKEFPTEVFVSFNSNNVLAAVIFDAYRNRVASSSKQLSDKEEAISTLKEQLKTKVVTLAIPFLLARHQFEKDLIQYNEQSEYDRREFTGVSILKVWKRKYEFEDKPMEES